MTLGSLEDAVRSLQAGGLACFPTETLWSLSCRADDLHAVRRILQVKGRPDEVPLAVGFATWDEARDAIETTPLADRLAAEHLPGPLSLVVRRQGDRFLHCAPGRDTVSIRVPDHQVAQAILRATGPLVMTSANRHGDPDPIRDEDVVAALPAVGDLVIMASDPVPGVPSTVVDATGDKPVVLRQGMIRLP